MLGLLLNALPAQPGDVAHVTKRREPKEPIANVEREGVRGKHRGFSYDALSVTNATICGGDKCYFEGERASRGWLVGGRAFLIQQSRGWAFAEKLREDFGVEHLLSGPPFLASLTRTQAKELNAKLNQSLDRSRRPLWRISGVKSKNGAKQHYTPGPHPVQEVRACPWPECMVLKCVDPNLLRGLGPNNLTAQAIEGFVARAPNKTRLLLGIQRNFAAMEAMIQAHPCLKTDFQVYVRNDGSVLNIDLDRCKRNKTGAVSLRDTEMRILTQRTITLTTEPLKLSCVDA